MNDTQDCNVDCEPDTHICHCQSCEVCAFLCSCFRSDWRDLGDRDGTEYHEDN